MLKGGTHLYHAMGQRPPKTWACTEGVQEIMMKWIYHAVISIVCFVILLTVLAILPPLFLPPGFEFGSMSAASIIAAGLAYLFTPVIYRKIAEKRKR
jgi:hypothetical protein